VRSDGDDVGHGSEMLTRNAWWDRSPIAAGVCLTVLLHVVFIVGVLAMTAANFEWLRTSAFKLAPLVIGLYQIPYVAVAVVLL
jgi:hypothetical protein